MRRTRAAHATLFLFVVAVTALLACAFSGTYGGAASSFSAAGAGRVSAQAVQAKAPDKGDFKIGFGDAKEKKNGWSKKEVADDQKELEGVAAELNKAIALPHDVYIHFGECGQANAFYDPQKKQITVCYELVASFYTAFAADAKTEKELDDEVGGATAFVFFHELGHALIDVLELPVTGREEDAVDQLSTLILADGSDEGEEMVINGAISLAGESEEELDAMAFADEHSLGPQRFYNILCLLYGQNEKKYAALVTEGVLPKERAVRCKDEFTRTDKAWNTLLAPYMK
jgi:hypothetical protein